jgi:hypothetical protein
MTRIMACYQHSQLHAAVLGQYEHAITTIQDLGTQLPICDKTLIFECTVSKAVAEPCGVAANRVFGYSVGANKNTRPTTQAQYQWLL